MPNRELSPEVFSYPYDSPAMTVFWSTALYYLPMLYFLFNISFDTIYCQGDIRQNMTRMLIKTNKGKICK